MKTFKKHFKLFYSIDIIVFTYLIGTFLFILFLHTKIPDSYLHLLFRAIFLTFMLCLPFFNKYLKNSLVLFFRTAYPLLFLGFFYTETDALNNVFSKNLDYYFARADTIIFGFQPSLAFFNRFPYAWFSELLNLSYFSYYFLITIFVIYYFRKDREAFHRTVFILTCSFLIYYIIFIFLPVSGPQYFFEPPHNTIPDSGLFRNLVKWVEFIGERPTAAFPSSHVGIVLIMIIIAFNKHKNIYYWLIPTSALLTLSTVYIKAHYAVDVIGGIVSAPIIYLLADLLWKSLLKYEPKFLKI